MYLAAGLLALFFGPLIYESVYKRRQLLTFLDGFIVVTIAGLLAIEVLPGIIANGGWWSLLLVAAGLLGPTLGEKVFRQHARKMHLTTLLFGAGGLILHTLIDGAVLHHPGHSEHHFDNSWLPIAVVLHRLPVGLAVWWVLRPSLGRRAGYIAIALMAVGTLAGYWLAGHTEFTTLSQGSAWLQAFVAGTILHVVLYRPHLHDHAHPLPSEIALSHAAEHQHSQQDQGNSPTKPLPTSPLQRALSGTQEGWGNLVGALLLLSLFWFTHETNIPTHHGHNSSWFNWDTLYHLAAISAPALLLAFLLGGLISVFMPNSKLHWLQRGGPARQAAKGMAFGLPLPICSCGVVPLYRSLVEKGVPPTAAMAFLIATPEIGLDAILLSLPLLGMEMTIARVAAAAILALAVGWGVGRLVIRWQNKHSLSTDTPTNSSSCCSQQHSSPDPHEYDPDPGPKQTVVQKIQHSLHEGFIKLVDNLAPWIVVGLLLATVAEPLLQQSWLTTLPNGIEVVLFGLIGMPIYVCATGATPLVAVFLAYGISPGAAVAFLLTGPATNVTTFGVLRDLHGAKAAIAFAACAGFAAIVLGLLVNQILPADLSQAGTQTEHHDHPSLLQSASLFILVGLFTLSIIRKGLREFVGSVFSMPGHSH